MARKGSLNAENLVVLGADRLAALLMELGDADPSTRKRLVLAVAEGGGPQAVAKAVDRRLTALNASRGAISWEKTRALASELDGLRRVIADTLAPLDASAAAERLRRFIGLAPKVFERVDDSSGNFGDVFRNAVLDLGVAWARITDRDPKQLAAEVLELLHHDDYGVIDGLVAAAAPALGEAGLLALNELVRAALTTRGNPATSHGLDWRKLRLQSVLSQVADARGDVDAYIAVQTAEKGDSIDVLGIARRLLDANRPAEALDWLDRRTPRPTLRVMTYADLQDHEAGVQRPPGLDWERETLRVRALEMLGRRTEAQEVRWCLFEQTLQADLLRSYLKYLPDFEDDEALERAFAVAFAHPSAVMALAFLIQWPNLKLAAKLVVTRVEALDGRHYEILNVAAEALGEHHAYAATLLHRRMIDSVLERAANKSYSYAAKNLRACAALAKQVDWTHDLQSHAGYVAGLRKRHGRKSGFWSLVAP